MCESLRISLPLIARLAISMVILDTSGREGPGPRTICVGWNPSIKSSICPDIFTEFAPRPATILTSAPIRAKASAIFSVKESKLSINNTRLFSRLENLPIFPGERRPSVPVIFGTSSIPSSRSGNSSAENPVRNPQAASVTAAAFHRASSTSALAVDPMTIPPPA